MGEVGGRGDEAGNPSFSSSSPFSPSSISHSPSPLLRFPSLESPSLFFPFLISTFPSRPPPPLVLYIATLISHSPLESLSISFSHLHRANLPLYLPDNSPTNNNPITTTDTKTNTTANTKKDIRYKLVSGTNLAKGFFFFFFLSFFRIFKFKISIITEKGKESWWPLASYYLPSLKLSRFILELYLEMGTNRHLLLENEQFWEDSKKLLEVWCFI